MLLAKRFLLQGSNRGWQRKSDAAFGATSWANVPASEEQPWVFPPESEGAILCSFLAAQAGAAGAKQLLTPQRHIFLRREVAQR
jgi:hypothetical protein